MVYVEQTLNVHGRYSNSINKMQDIQSIGLVFQFVILMQLQLIDR